jgi:hypothetical protein
LVTVLAVVCGSLFLGKHKDAEVHEEDDDEQGEEENDENVWFGAELEEQENNAGEEDEAEAMQTVADVDVVVVVDDKSS